MIDLHLHATASDGASTPAGLAAEARAAGLTIIAVTDHDTTAAIDEVTEQNLSSARQLEDAARSLGETALDLRALVGSTNGHRP